VRPFSDTRRSQCDPSITEAVEAATEPLWRAVAVFRFLALVYVLVAYLLLNQYFARPGWGWVVVGVMAAWTFLVSYLYRTPAGRRSTMVVTDIGVACLAIAVTPLVDDPARIAHGEPTLALVWPVAALLAAAVRWGLPGGLLAAVATSAASLTARGEFAWTTARNIVLLLVTGTVVGYAAGLFRRSQTALVQALRIQAAAGERDRLARSVHDGVLQVLALVQRQAGDLGGVGPELARAAGEQEIALRALVSRPIAALGTSQVDLVTLLSVLESTSLTLARPPDAVLLPEFVARELTAAVVAAADNVTRHAGVGAHTWVLVEDESDRVTVTVRDDGMGIAEGRLAEAASLGRLGVGQSIVGRVRDLGGDVTVESVEGQGTEIEFHVPRLA